MFISLLLVTMGCSGPQILGSKRHLLDGVEVVRDLNVSSLHIRQTRIADKECSNGYTNTIELDGPINSDSAYVIGKVLNELDKCYKSGKNVVPTVYLNSSGGRLLDGYEIGRIFRENSVSTRVIEGQVCASACAVAFLGGHFRQVTQDARLVFHAPYVRTAYGIECKDKNSTEHLLNYYREMLVYSSDAQRLFERTMSHCGESSGWVLDSGAADLFGISKN